ncbi:MAG: hypothetical protein HZA31_04895 [Opitutae bacterium]|nr:hypothetical protein [Opitutae bacterium]
MPALALFAEEKAGKPSPFVNLGAQLTSRTFQGSAFTRDAAGHQLLCTVVRSQPCAKLVVADALSGDVIGTYSLEGANGAWGAVTAKDGSVYIGTENNGKVFRFVPGEKAVRDLGRPFPEETFVWDLTAGKGDEIYGGTYPNGRAFRYSPSKGFEDVANGPVVPGQQYARSIAYADDHKLYVGIGTSTPHLVEIDLNTGAKTDMLPAQYLKSQSVYTLSVVGDRVFGMLAPDQLVLVFDRKTRKLETTFKKSGLYQLVSPASPYDGRVYYCEGGKLMAFDPAQPEKAPASVGAVTNVLTMTWLQVEPKDAGLSLAIYNMDGRVITYHPPTGKMKTWAVNVPEQPSVIQSLVLGPDGRLWMGGYLSGGAAAFDPQTGKTEQFRNLSQAEHIEAVGDRLFFGIYPRGRLFVQETAKPWRPKSLGQMEDQSRPIAMAVVPEVGKLYIGNIPEYGILGGALGVCDLATDKLTWLPKFVEKQSVASLLAVDGLLVGGTTVAGGLGIEPTEKEGKLFVFDPKAGQKLCELIPVPGKMIVSGLMRGPDGLIWGVAAGTLFGFDLKSREVKFTKEIMQPDFTKQAAWQDAALAIHPNKLIYGFEEGCFFSLDPATKAVTILRKTVKQTHTRSLAIDRAGRVYFSDGPELWQYTP